MKETIKSATMVIIINLLNLLITTLFGFLVSICLDYDNYAYYKLYGLYVSFVGFGHFGFINGIYLKYGRYNYEELPRDKFCVFFRVLLLMQLLVVLILAGTTAVSSIETIKKHVLLYVCMNLSVININCYFALVNQFTKRFRYDCYAVIGKCIVEVVLIVLLLLDCICDGNSVLFWVFVENMLMLIINIINNRTIVFGHCKIDKYIIRECRGFVKVGFFVMISEFIGLIVLGIDGLFVYYYF